MSQTSENDLFLELQDVEYRKLREELDGKDFNPMMILQVIARAEVAVEAAYGMVHGLLTALQDSGVVDRREEGKFTQSPDFTPAGKFNE